MDGYIRVSRRMGRQGPAYISPKVQRDAIQRWADYRGVEIVAWHVDEDESGGTQSRPGLREAMDRIERGETDGLACWRLNRFARNVSDAIRDIKRIEAADAHLALVQEGIDPSGQFGMFLLTILLAVATLERDNAIAGFQEAKRRAVERGAYISRTPFGYQREEDGTISPHPEQGSIVTEAFRLAAGDSLQAALEHLRRTAPQRKWTATKARRLLTGRSYLGETRNGDMVKLGTHDPLVTRAIWEAAQTTPVSRGPRETFPLSALAHCGSCGQEMIGSRGGKGQRVYRCSGTQARHGLNAQHCDRGTVITASKLEDHVRSRALRIMAGVTVKVSEPDADAVTLLERALHDAEAELDAFAADMNLRRALGDRYHVHLSSRVDAVERARSVYREKARKAAANVTVTTADLLGDPQAFAVGLRSIVDSILVIPGRGLSASERVFLLPFDADRAPRIPGAEQA